MTKQDCCAWWSQPVSIPDYVLCAIIVFVLLGSLAAWRIAHPLASPDAAACCVNTIDRAELCEATVAKLDHRIDAATIALRQCNANVSELVNRSVALRDLLTACRLDSAIMESDVGFEKASWLRKWINLADKAGVKKDLARLRELRMALLAWFVACACDVIDLILCIPRLLHVLMLSLIV